MHYLRLEGYRTILVGKMHFIGCTPQIEPGVRDHPGYAGTYWDI